MKIPERTGKRVEMERSTDRSDEVTIRVPNTIGAAWTMDVCVKDEDLAGFLRSLGWEVSTPRPQANVR